MTTKQASELLRQTLDEDNPIPVLDHGFVRLVDVMGTDMRIVEAARVSYKSASKGEEADKKLLFYLYKNLHTSPFEMCKMTFNIKMPIFIARQYVRHRMQNINEQSARYSQLPADFYIPTKWRAQDTKNKQGSVLQEEWPSSFHLNTSEQLASWCRDAYKLYESMLAAGIAREMARMVLPLNIYTEFYTTWDLKNLLHFFSLRDDPHAQWEHQQYGKAMKMFAQHYFPWTMEAYEKFKFPCLEIVKA